MRRLAAIVFGVSMALCACELFLPQTKMDKGVLYESGDPRFDQFFGNVHKQQVSASGWDEERRTTRKQLATQLNVVTTASDASILAALRGHRTDPAVVAAAGDAAAHERDRAAKMRQRSVPLDDLSRQGQSLVGLVRDAFRAQGEPKVREVREEVNASVSLLDGLVSRSKTEAADADHFVEDMNGALQGRLPVHEHGAATPPPAETAKPAPTQDPTPPPSAAPSGSAKPVAKPTPVAQPKPVDKPTPPPATAKPVDPPAEKPADKPKPPPSGGDDVFNP